MTYLLWLMATVLAVYLAMLAFIWFKQDSLLVRPSKLPMDHVFSVGSDVKEVFLEVPGARLNALHLRVPNSKGIVFFMHGNAGSLQDWFVNPDYFRAMKMDLYMLDYRGFGKSTGHIQSQSQLLDDVAHAWQSIQAEYVDKSVVFLGRSLGSGLVSHLAASLPADRRPNKLVLVSPYESLQALAGEYFWYVPSMLLRYPMRTDLALASLASSSEKPLRPSVALIHGSKDELIKIRHSERLKAIRPDAKLVRIEGAAHNDLQAYEAYLDRLRQEILEN